jgi:hypothetical protein
MGQYMKRPNSVTSFSNFKKIGDNMNVVKEENDDYDY